MNFRLLLTLMNYKRIPKYVYSLLYSSVNGLIFLKRDFQGMLSLPEGCKLHLLAKSLPKNSKAIEIGCYGGLSTSFILSGLDKTSMLYSIDPFDKDLKMQRGLIQKYKDKDYKEVEIKVSKNKPSKKSIYAKLQRKGFKNFGLITGYSTQIAKGWNKKIDFLWIDANHEYHAVKKDYLDWIKFLKKDGVIALHDSKKQSNSPYWDWGWNGPTKVVNEFIKEPNWVSIGNVDSITYATKNF